MIDKKNTILRRAVFGPIVAECGVACELPANASVQTLSEAK